MAWAIRAVQAGKRVQALEVQPLRHVIHHRELDDQLRVDRASRSAAGGEATRVRVQCRHFFGRYRRAAATMAPAAAITSSVRRVSPPKMTSATPLSTTEASAFRPAPRKCRRAAGCPGRAAGLDVVHVY